MNIRRIFFLHIKASESWSFEWVIKTGTPVESQQPTLPPTAWDNPISLVLRIWIGDPVPFWPLDFRSRIQDRDPGWVKSQDPDPGIWDGKPGSYFWELRKPFFLKIKILKFFDIADPGSRIQMEKIWIRDQGSRMEKIWIRDPGWK